VVLGVIGYRMTSCYWLCGYNRLINFWNPFSQQDELTGYQATLTGGTTIFEAEKLREDNEQGEEKNELIVTSMTKLASCQCACTHGLYVEDAHKFLHTCMSYRHILHNYRKLQCLLTDHMVHRFLTDL